MTSTSSIETIKREQLKIKDDEEVNTLEVHLSQVLADSHDNILPKKKLLIVFGALASALFLSFVDQNGITIALPDIAEELDAQETVSWAGTSSLISQTVFMVLFGRFSDIFSRKYVLIASMVILSLSDLACALAQTPYQLYIFRGFSGIGNGGITSLSMMIVSDIVTLEERGKYQGILGSCVGLGNAIGPFLASAFITHTHSWRKFYFMLFPLVISGCTFIVWLVPYTHHKQDMKKQFSQIDVLGFLSSSVTIIFLLIPISGGGSTYKWDSAFSIAFLCIGGVSFIVFLIVEKKFALLPMMPLHLFNTRVSLNFLFAQNFFFGICYFGMLYYIPFYLQSIRGFNTIDSSKYMLCMVFPQVFVSVISGQIISRHKHYWHVVWFGYTFWTVGMGLLLLWGTTTPISITIGALVVTGCGIGATFQPTLIAVQAQSYRKDRAIVISTRNVLRCFGGSVGLAVASTILSNFYNQKLTNYGASYFSSEEVKSLKSQVFSIPSFDKYSLIQVQFLKNIYMESLKNVFYLWIGCIAFCLLSNATVRDTGLEPLQENVNEK
ncbi:hypothetical protein WICANDRAFT_83650 [Wickerhamomyces anomalus NRRL Y-366-8]|uniref:Major facilitator superfamily (MFS) profile domain-containing protein n=1 Tax=Wickerhamomyces anomalus (strain ATCC 58044 / CBS 1984 / NCYC 433 / NRRL Y-366-8) TaxID=683960 RepID=A0A1E3P3N6_WICAA|nr:uncharacterized protein WICANDRAFT_83650 [Wickerhamomyces anomalus NRRL Y-366-8]ODQ59512.1 hypothetical protein WICANDRAFT_83650 [Wickerhamomyces anomalus NRRL Y-366-8]